MAGFEVVVRPAVFPDIRPRPTPALPPADDPTKGFAVIQGNPAGSTSSSFSVSISSSNSRPVETQRRVDTARIYQKDDDGTVSEDNFIDVQVANKISMNEPGSSIRHYFYKPVEEDDNIEILERNKIVRNNR